VSTQVDYGKWFLKQLRDGSVESASGKGRKENRRRETGGLQEGPPKKWNPRNPGFRASDWISWISLFRQTAS